MGKIGRGIGPRRVDISSGFFSVRRKVRFTKGGGFKSLGGKEPGKTFCGFGGGPINGGAEGFGFRGLGFIKSGVGGGVKGGGCWGHLVDWLVDAERCITGTGDPARENLYLLKNNFKGSKNHVFNVSPIRPGFGVRNDRNQKLHCVFKDTLDFPETLFRFAPAGVRKIKFIMNR